jgi:biotin transport system substrate-specific component
VSKELSAQLKPLRHATAFKAAAATGSSAWLRACGIAVLGSALVAACAHVALPLYFTPVPLSMAPFAVLVLGLLLRPRLAAATLGLYLAEGAVGLPVFAPTLTALGGLAHLLGPTGGYLLSYPLAAASIAFLARQPGAGWNRGFARAAMSAAAGSFVILACGALWLAALTHASMGAVLSLAVLPFLPGDALKIVLAAALVEGFARYRRRNA